MNSDPPHTVDAATRLIVLLGHPVSHSLSPLMHNAAFRALRLPLIYLACDVLPDQLGHALEGIRALGIAGANVTVPHKTAVAGLVDDLDALARRIGAVNTLVNMNGRLVGYNTDGPGFLAALDEFWKRPLDTSTVLVLGAGGAARAVVAALVERRVKELLIWNRTAWKARTLCTEALSWGAHQCSVWDPADTDVTTGVDLVVQATAAGLGDKVKRPVLDVGVFGKDTCIMDLQYGESPLVAAARARGLRAVDGTEMLVRQGALSFALWTGVTAPLDVMRRIATSETQNRR